MVKLSGIKCHVSYVGGKYHLAKWIISNFPEHDVYVEPFGGSAHVLVQKYPSKLEVYNDINIDIVNLFRVLQNKTKRKELIELLQFTPYSRKWFCDLRDGKYEAPTKDEEVKKAYRFIALSKQAFNGKVNNTTPSWSSNLDKAILTSSFINFTNKYIYELIDRFKQVQIESLDFKKLIKRYDSPETLFYCDPPYWDYEDYYKERFSKQDHVDLAKMLNNIEGKACVSYSPFEKLSELYPTAKWRRVERERAVSLQKKKKGEKREKAIELLIMNYDLNKIC